MKIHQPKSCQFFLNILINISQPDYKMQNGALMFSFIALEPSFFNVGISKINFANIKVPY